MEQVSVHLFKGFEFCVWQFGVSRASWMEMTRAGECCSVASTLSLWVSTLSFKEEETCEFLEPQVPGICLSNTSFYGNQKLKAPAKSTISLLGGWTQVSFE